MICSTFFFQMLKERLCFDPEFWNLLTLRTRCLELMSDKVMKAAVLSEMKDEDDKQDSEELLVNNICAHSFNSCKCAVAAHVDQDLPEVQTADGEADKRGTQSHDGVLKRRNWRRRLRRRKQATSDDEADHGDDPDIKYNLTSTSVGNKPMYSLRRNRTNMDNSTVKLPLNRKREYLSRCVKSQILKRKGRKKRWLQGLPKLEQLPAVKEKKKQVRGLKRGRKPLSKLELSFPDNEIFGFEELTDTDDKKPDMPYLEIELKQDKHQQTECQDEQMVTGTGDEVTYMPPLDSEKLEKEQQQKETELGGSVGVQTGEEAQTELGGRPRGDPAPAVEGDHELDGPLLDLFDCPAEQFHCYCLRLKTPDNETLQPSDTDVPNGDTEQEPQPTEETEISNSEVSVSVVILPGICLKSGIPNCIFESYLTRYTFTSFCFE